jgi:hypothetical protein
MPCWTALFQRRSKSPQDGDLYSVVFLLSSEDGKRSVEVREFADGQVYLLESEQTYEDKPQVRHEGRLVGPFKSPRLAEQFIVKSSWFRGEPPPSGT